MTNTQKLAQFISGNQEIPRQVLNMASRLIMDSIGCALGALRSEQANVVLEYTRAQGVGDERVLGTGILAGPSAAAYANGRLINIIDMDETYLVLGHHANAALGAALALAKTCHLTGEGLLRAFVIGYEVGARVGNFMGVQLKTDRNGKVCGWNFPGPCLGTFAACASACVCLGLSAEQVENALGICAMYLPSNSGGIWEEGRKRSTLPTVKYEDCGLNTQCGLMAAQMAGAGITGTLGIFERDVSLAQVASPGCTPNYEAIVDNLGEDWRLLRTSYKLWPSCRWFHYALTALQYAIHGKSFEPEMIKSVEIWSASSCVLNASPEIGKNTEMDASFSVPHSVAMVLMGVPAGPKWFDPTLVYDTKVAELRRKVKIYLNPELENAKTWGNYQCWGQAGAALKVPSRVVVTTCDGDTLEGYTEYALGDGWNEMVCLSDETLKEKFVTVASAADPDSSTWNERIRILADRILRIADEPSAEQLLADLDVDTFCR